MRACRLLLLGDLNFRHHDAAARLLRPEPLLVAGLHRFQQAGFLTWNSIVIPFSMLDMPPVSTDPSGPPPVIIEPVLRSLIDGTKATIAAERRATAQCGQGQRTQGTCGSRTCGGQVFIVSTSTVRPWEDGGVGRHVDSQAIREYTSPKMGG